jgi:hypothetical protein
LGNRLLNEEHKYHYSLANGIIDKLTKEEIAYIVNQSILAACLISPKGFPSAFVKLVKRAVTYRAHISAVTLLFPGQELKRLPE